MKKKILILLTALIMVFTVACNGGTTVSLLEFIDSNTSGQLDLEGATFWFFTEWEDNFHIPEDYSIVPSLALELKNDRIIKAEKELNMSMEFYWDDVTMRISAGYGAPEVIDHSIDYLYDYYKAGILTPIEDVSTIDLDSGMWGSRNFIKYGNFNGKQYGIFPINWMTPETTGAMMYNGTLVKTLGGTVPYEYRENGTWTWETFENELKKYPITYADTPLTALYAQNLEVLGFAALHSNDLRIIEGDETTGYYFGFNNNKSYQALEWLNSLYKDGLIGTGDMDSFTVGNECVYYIGESYYGTANNAASGSNYAPLVMEDFGFITFPHGPNGTEKNVGSYTYGSRRLHALSDKANIEIDLVGAVLNYIYAPLEEYGEEYWRSQLRDLVLQSEESFNNWLEIVELPEYNFSTQLEKSMDIINSALSAAITGKKTPVVAMTEIAQPISEAAENISFGE